MIVPKNHYLGLDTKNPYFVACKKNSTFLHAKNKGADQPMHLHSLILAFVFHSLQSVIFKLASYKISLF